MLLFLLDKGDYLENLHAVICPNKWRSFETFTCLDSVLECHQSFLFQIFLFFFCVCLSSNKLFFLFFFSFVFWGEVGVGGAIHNFSSCLFCLPCYGLDCSVLLVSLVTV